MKVLIKGHSLTFAKIEVFAFSSEMLDETLISLLDQLGRFNLNTGSRGIKKADLTLSKIRSTSGLRIQANTKV